MQWPETHTQPPPRKNPKGGAKGKEGSVGSGNAATSLYKSIKKVL